MSSFIVISLQGNCVVSFILSCIFSIERDVAQWLERGALPISLPVVRFRIPLAGAGFSEKYHVSPLSIFGHYFDVVSLGEHFILTCFT